MWVWLAEQAPGGVPPPAWDVFAQYSVLGIGVLALAFVAWRMLMLVITRNDQALARETARADRLEQELREANAVLQDKALPALFASSTAITEYTGMFREMQRDRERDRERERDYARRRRDGEDR